MLHGQRIQGGAADMPVINGMIKRSLIDKAPAAAINEHGSFFHRFHLLFLKHVPRRFFQRQMQGDQITRL